MKQLAKILALATAFASGAGFAAAKVGEPAPAFTLPGSDGKSHSLADYKGKLVVLEWTNDHCPFVVKHYGSGNMQALQKEAKASGVTWLTMISSAPGKHGHVNAQRANELTSERGAAPAQVLFDESGNVGRSYEAKTTPHMYLIDKDGKLIYAGGIDSIPSTDAADVPKATPYVKVAMSEALAGKAISNPSTKPYGCAVKY